MLLSYMFLFIDKKNTQLGAGDLATSSLGNGLSRNRGECPDVIDANGNLTGGAVINGQPADSSLKKELMGCVLCYEEVIHPIL